jgi:heme/copper-type cytochrome/quinol oxidase subunit 1
MRIAILFVAVWAAILWRLELRESTQPRITGVAKTKYYFSLHAIIFVLVTTLWMEFNFLNQFIDHRFLNVWSNTIRFHALLCILMSAILKRHGKKKSKE